MHSHDLREWSEFKGKRILVIGASYSAEDIALTVGLFPFRLIKGENKL